MAVTDPAVARWVPYEEGVARPDVIAAVRYGAGVAGALLVLLLGKWLAARRRVAPAAAGVAAAADATAAIGHLKRIVLAVDESEGAARAVRRLIALRDDLRHGATLELHLLTVQRPLSGDVTRFIAGKTVDDYYREQAELALAPARAALDAAGLAHTDHWRIGEPGPTIAELAREQACDMVVMGARGMGGATAALLGSVAQSAIEHATMPVLVVK